MDVVTFDAMVVYDKLLGISVFFTPQGKTEFTDERFKAFCRDREEDTIRANDESRDAFVIRGVICETPTDPLRSMWLAAEQVKKHFGINCDVIHPRA